jgi:hypothetical protein
VYITIRISQLITLTDLEGRLIFLIIILPQYNIAEGNIKLQKMAGTSLFRTQKGPFKGLKVSVFKRNIVAI